MVEPVGREILGDALAVPHGWGHATEREREGMHPLVEQQVATVGRIRLVEEPEAIAVAETIGKRRDRVGKQPRLPKPLAIHHKTANRPPVTHIAAGKVEVIAPCCKGLIENSR